MAYQRKKGCANEQRQWDYDVKQLRQRFPLGHLDDGPPDQVAGYVQGYIGLIKERLTSRAQYVYTHAAQEAAALSMRANGTSTTKRRRDAEPYRLQEEAADHLRAVGHLFETLTAWTRELTAGLQSPGTSVGESASDSKMIRSNHNPAVRTAMPETEGPSVKNGAESGGRRPVSANAEGPAHSHGKQEPATTRMQDSASRESAARDDRAKRTSALERVGHQLSLFGAQANSMNTQKSEDDRQVSKSVRPASPQTLTNPDPRTLPNQQQTVAPGLPTSEQAGVKSKTSTGEETVRPVDARIGKRLIEKPVETKSVGEKDNDDKRSRAAIDAPSVGANARTDSLLARKPDEQSVRPIEKLHKTVGQPSSGNGRSMSSPNRSAADYLIKMAEKRELLVLRDGPEMFKVNSPLGSSDAVQAVLREKVYQDRLSKIFDETGVELTRLSQLTARSAKEIDEFLRTGKRGKSFSSGQENLLTAWKSNEDVRRTVAQIASLPVLKLGDREDELERRVLFMPLILNRPAAQQELEQRLAAEELTLKPSNEVYEAKIECPFNDQANQISDSSSSVTPSVPWEQQTDFGI